MKKYHEETESIIIYDYICLDFGPKDGVEYEHKGNVNCFVIYTPDGKGKFIQHVLTKKEITSMYEAMVAIESETIIKKYEEYIF